MSNSLQLFYSHSETTRKSCIVSQFPGKFKWSERDLTDHHGNQSFVCRIFCQLSPGSMWQVTIIKQLDLFYNEQDKSLYILGPIFHLANH